MKNFINDLILECIAEVEAVGITPGEIEKWEINRRAKTRWGQCKKQKNGKFVIQISNRLILVVKKNSVG